MGFLLGQCAALKTSVYFAMGTFVSSTEQTRPLGGDFTTRHILSQLFFVFRTMALQTGGALAKTKKSQKLFSLKPVEKRFLMMFDVFDFC